MSITAAISAVRAAGFTNWVSPCETVMLVNADCLDVLPVFDAQSFAVCLTDPPYGIDYENAGGFSEHCGWVRHEKLGWDCQPPEQSAFDELRRVSQKQVVWGGNYFTDKLPPSMGWLIWNKGQRGFSLADAEVAWTSENRAIRICDLPRAEANREPRLHWTQKPTRLMQWSLDWIGDGHVVDPYCGSGTTAIACLKESRRCVCIEREPTYYAIAINRVSAALGMEVPGLDGTVQRRLWAPEVSQ